MIEPIDTAWVVKFCDECGAVFDVRAGVRQTDVCDECRLVALRARSNRSHIAQQNRIRAARAAALRVTG